MNYDFAAAMRRAAHLARAGDVATATRVIQGALREKAASRQTEMAQTAAPPQQPSQGPMLRLVAPDGGTSETSGRKPSVEARTTSGKGSFQPLPRTRKPLGEVMRLLSEGRRKTGTLGSLPGMIATGRLKASQAPPIPEGAQFLTRSFSCVAGTRSYKFYIPASATDQPHGLVVMLHGCKQDPDDFAAGTNMNAVAEAHGFMVAYPAQSGSDNAMCCWNWFNPADQMRDAGEPSIIAGVTREIASQYQLDRQVVFVAGLSAGGAMAAVMGETYPDLYSAVGIHSGLAYKSANDVVTAFAAMRGEAGPFSPAKPGAKKGAKPCVRTIVFQGSADHTVSPANALEIVDAASPQGDVASFVEQGVVVSGRSYTRTVIEGMDGEAAVEYWLIHGVGHAWSGGRPEGSYTDPQGPNASAEMMRFFLNGVRRLISRSDGHGAPPLAR
jgi:poly(hydroxyalkanoate) depolymerase family esterase